MENDWNVHANAVTQKKLPPAATLTKGLLQLEMTTLAKTATDLGSGNGIDTLELLHRGWKVTAIDNHLPSLQQLKKITPEPLPENLTVEQSLFEQVSLSPVTLINASFSLPFCAPSHFNTLWQKITAALPAGGVFAGHFFGIRDSWHNRSDMTFHERTQVISLLEPFTINWIEETEKDGKTVSGHPKHWHVFHITATKK
jgi:tellurite methyltransferase